MPLCKFILLPGLAENLGFVMIILVLFSPGSSPRGVPMHVISCQIPIFLCVVVSRFMTHTTSIIITADGSWSRGSQVMKKVFIVTGLNRESRGCVSNCSRLLIFLLISFLFAFSLMSSLFPHYLSRAPAATLPPKARRTYRFFYSLMINIFLGILLIFPC